MSSFFDSHVRDLPAFVHLQEFWRPAEKWPSHAELDADCIVRFVEPSSNREDFSAHYEVRIAESKEVETRRECWHDLCNALIWKAYPLSKWALNQRYYRALCTRQESWTRSSVRSREEDFCTVINENMLVIAYTQEEDKKSVQLFQWHDLFWKRRAGLDERMELFFWGHALLEKSIHPYIGMTGHAIFVLVEDDFFSLSSTKKVVQIDKAVVDFIEKEEVCSVQELSPFPILGFPGFHRDAEEESFYRNTRYFRSGRRQKKKK